MMKRNKTRGAAIFTVGLVSLLIAIPLYAQPELPPTHTNDASTILWEADGIPNGDSAHNHRSARSFGGFTLNSVRYDAFACWDNRNYRVDRAGLFDRGHCFINEGDSPINIPRYFFVGNNWPPEAQQRVREAFAAWGTVRSDRPNLVTGIAFTETFSLEAANDCSAGTRTATEICIEWRPFSNTNVSDNWDDANRILSFNSTFNWYFAVDPRNIQNGHWHFFSRALHEVGQVVGLARRIQTQRSLMRRVATGEPPERGASEYFTGLDDDAIEGVRDLYSQPFARRAFVVDDTNSMGSEIKEVKVAIGQDVDQATVPLEYRLITFKDTVTDRGTTSDRDEIKRRVNDLSAAEGNDCPEEMLGALRRTAAVASTSGALLMTDAGFHGDFTDVARTADQLARANVVVYPILYPGECLANGGPSSTGPDIVGADAYRAFGEIAARTGGARLWISTPETQRAAGIVLNEMATTSTILAAQDSVTGGATKRYSIEVDSRTSEANVLMTSTTGAGGTNLALFDPTGVKVTPEDNHATSTILTTAQYYRIPNPTPGTWHAEVSGDGTFALKASNVSDILLSYRSDASLVKGVPVTLLASLSGGVVAPSFQLVHLDGTIQNTVAMFDDGVHNDGSANDGIYGGAYTPPTAGTFYLRAQGTTDDGTLFERTDPSVIRVQTLRVEAPAGTMVAPGGEELYEFTIANDGAEAESLDLKAISSQGWADTSGVPASITVPAGGTSKVAVPVHVPPSAALATVDQLQLVVASRLNIGVSQIGTVFTTVGIAPPNLLANPGFEQDDNGDGKPDSWSSNSKVSRSNEVVHTGGFAMRHAWHDDASYMIRQQIAGVSANATYRLSGWLNIPPTDDSFSFRIELRWQDGRGHSTGTDTLARFSAATNGWTEAAASLIAPPGTEQAEVRLIAKSLRGPLYTDDFALTLEAPSPPLGNRLTNGSFELDQNNDGAPDDWTRNRFVSRSGEMVYDGDFAMKHASDRKASYTVRQTVSHVVGDTRYRFSSQVAIPAGSNAHSFTIDIIWRDEDDETLRIDTIKTYKFTTDGWDEAAALLVAPEGTTNAQVRMTMKRLNGTIYVDAAVLEAVAQ